MRAILLLSKNKGFTLIELMIVVTIIGILSAFAVPAYHKYILKARFGEVIAATSPFKLSVSLALQQGIPISNINSGQSGVPDFTDPTDNIKNISVSHGIITALGTELVKDNSYVLSPNSNGTNWSISGTCVSAGIC